MNTSKETGQKYKTRKENQAVKNGRVGCVLGKESNWIGGLRFQFVDLPVLW